ncbi:MAG: ParB/RepB/Spo0J family partition protein [Candidatus Hinthialibacter antarcticus]|nr:ParB/RepB/Spo0J family partition protein [Candidatus Hinthialibacter antarcticus]
MKRKALGRGLSALLSDSSVESVAEPQSKRIDEIEVGAIEANRWQPRTQFDDEQLKELSESIGAQGVLQPLLVRRKPDGSAGYQLIAGERRLRASKLAGLGKVPCILLEAQETQALEIALVENIQRSNLSPVEEARAYKQMVERFNLTQEQISAKVGKSRAAVTNALRLLNLPVSVLDLLDSGVLSVGHAKVLLSVKDTDKIESLALRILEEEWSVRQLEEELRGKPPAAPKPAKAAPEDKDIFVSDMKRKLEEALQTKVDIRMKGKNKGRIDIHFYDLDQLDHLLKLWKISL